jgi:hypothetical protein
MKFLYAIAPRILSYVFLLAGIKKKLYQLKATNLICGGLELLKDEKKGKKSSPGFTMVSEFP